MALQAEVQTKLVEFVLAHLELSYQTIADRLGCSVPTLSRICILHKVRRKRANLTMADIAKLES